MSYLSQIILSENDIKEIEASDLLYRNIDLKKLAIKYENDLIQGKSSLFSMLLYAPGIKTFNILKRISVNKKVIEDGSNSRLLNLEDLKYPPKRVQNKLYYNRASYKQQSIFYGGFGDFQAMSICPFFPINNINKVSGCSCYIFETY